MLGTAQGALPFRYDIHSFADVKTRQRFRWVADGTAVDLTGWTARLHIGQDGELVTEVTDGVTVDSSGLVDMSIAAGALPEGTYWYVLDLIAPSGDWTRFVNGSLRLGGIFP